MNEKELQLLGSIAYMAQDFATESMKKLILQEANHPDINDDFKAVIELYFT